jgi:hypothetical protein
MHVLYREKDIEKMKLVIKNKQYQPQHHEHSDDTEQPT